MVQSFVQRQDQLKLQAQQEEQLRQQAEQVRLANEQTRLQNERQQQQYDLQLRQQNYVEQTGAANQDRQARLDALGQRETEVKNALSPGMNGFMDGVTAELERYAPTAKGLPNPQYNQALFMAAKARAAKAQKLWNDVTLAVGSGQGYDEAKQAFLAFTGQEVAAAPMTPAPAAPTTAAPPVMDMKFAPPAAPAPVSVQEPGGASFNFTPEQIPQAAPLSLPQDLRDLPIDQLLNLEDQQLISQYGEPGLQYANAVRAQRLATLKSRSDAAQQANVTLWNTQFEQLAKNPDLTPRQRAAMHVITQLNQKDAADTTPEDRQLFAQAVTDLAPAMYTPVTWQKVLDTKDPATILAQLPVYQKLAPDVVAGFDPSLLQTQMQAELDETTANAAQSYAAAGNSISQTTERDALLPGAVAQQGATLAGTVATTQQTQAQTAKAAVDTQAAKVKLGLDGIELLASLPPNLSYFQMTQGNPELVSRIKASLGLNDQGMYNLWKQAQYQYGLGLKDEELKNVLTAAQIEGENARRGLTIAQTEGAVAQTERTRTLLPGEVAQQGAQTALTQAQTGGAVAQAQRTLTLLPGEVVQQGAQTALTTAQTANAWADTAKVAEDIKDDRVRTAAYIKGVEGGYAVDMAQVNNLTARTALARAENPNDPLYNPVVAASKPGDPLDALKKKAEIYYAPMERALDTAAAQQKSIDGLVKQYTGASGSVDLKRLQADPQYVAAVKARDSALKSAQDYRQKGDNVITGGMAAATAVSSKQQPVGRKITTGVSAAQSWAAKYPEVPGVSSDCAAIAGKYLNDLGLSIPTSNLSAGLEANAKKAGWSKMPATGKLMPGDLVVWTGPQYGLQKSGGVGKHVGVVAGFDAQGRPMILDNPGMLSDGTQGTTRVRPMSEAGAATVYRSPRSAGLNPANVPAATQQPPAATPSTPKATTAPAMSNPLPGVKRPRLSTADLAVASRAEQGLLRAVKAGDGNTQYAMYTQLVQFGYDSGAVLAYIKANQGKK